MRSDIHYLEAKDHVHIYSPQTIKWLLENNGFRNIQLIHLHPMQGISGKQYPFLTIAKNIWSTTADKLEHFTKGKLNLDNLFVVAYK